jgi:phosphoglycolate phosphatase
VRQGPPASEGRTLPPRLLILDFDGTLADSWPWFLTTLADITARFRLDPISTTEAEALRGEEIGVVMRRIGVPLWRVPAIAAHLRRAAIAAPAPPLFPGIPDMLRRLHAAGVGLAVASSNSTAQIRRALAPELAGLIGHFATEATLFGKASRFRRILRATAVAPGEAMAVGDEPRDIEAAREAGIAAGAVAWGYARPTLLATRGPDALFDSPEAIAAYCGA